MLIDTYILYYIIYIYYLYIYIIYIYNIIYIIIYIIYILYILYIYYIYILYILYYLYMCLYVFIDVFICLFICLFIIYLFLHVSTIFYFHCIWHKTHATLWLWAKCSDQRVCVQKNMGTAGLRWVIKFHQQQTKGISSTAPPAPTAQRNPEEVHPNFPGRCVV